MLHLVTRAVASLDARTESNFIVLIFLRHLFSVVEGSRVFMQRKLVKRIRKGKSRRSAMPAEPCCPRRGVNHSRRRSALLRTRAASRRRRQASLLFIASCPPSWWQGTARRRHVPFTCCAAGAPPIPRAQRALRRTAEYPQRGAQRGVPQRHLAARPRDNHAPLVACRLAPRRR